MVVVLTVAVMSAALRAKRFEEIGVMRGFPGKSWKQISFPTYPRFKEVYMWRPIVIGAGKVRSAQTPQEIVSVGVQDPDDVRKRKRMRASRQILGPGIRPIPLSLTGAVVSY